LVKIQVKNCANFRSEQCTVTNDIEFYLNESSTKKSLTANKLCCNDADTLLEENSFASGSNTSRQYYIH
uniref:Uncharacterized protein n=1 Tax=Romanomermis culicivorax TaxID=13658 RepID=A0A915J4Y3_ROMCU